MAARSMFLVQSSSAIAASTQRAAAFSQTRSYVAAGLPGLNVRAKSSTKRQSRHLRSEFLPTATSLSKFNLSRRASGVAGGRGGALTSTSFASDPEQLKFAKEDIKKLLVEKKPFGIFIRLGWHDSGSFTNTTTKWPQRGGANGSIRFSPELGHGANAGLINAIKLLEPVKSKYSGISYADLFQLASATAIEEAGGPKLQMKYGRVDTTTETECAVEGLLPDGDPPVPSDHLRQVFYRMGFSDQEIVALSGAHTIGRSRPDRSGFGKPETKYTSSTSGDIGAPGGQSWTVKWLTFDNSYFKDIKAQSDEDLLVLPTDKILTEDPGFKPYTDKYAEDQEAFFKDYAAAHKKLSELGSKWEPPEGFSIDEEPKPAEKFVASKYSSGGSESGLSDTMKQKIRAEYLAVGGSPDKPLKSNYFLNIIIAVAVLAIISSFITKN